MIRNLLLTRCSPVSPKTSKTPSKQRWLRQKRWLLLLIRLLKSPASGLKIQAEARARKQFVLIQVLANYPQIIYLVSALASLVVRRIPRMILLFH